MLIWDTRVIGNKLFAVRKRFGLTQEEAAEAAGLALRTYADIERGTANMRVDTALRICEALHITPDEIFTQNETDMTTQQAEILARLNASSPKVKETALRLLSVYLQSVSE